MNTADIKTFMSERMPDFVLAWFPKIKTRAGYSEALTAFDTEIQDAMEAAVTKMLAAGVPEDLFVTEDPIDKRIIIAITSYVNAYCGQDRTDTNKYLKLFSDGVKNLQLEDGGAWDVDISD